MSYKGSTPKSPDPKKYSDGWERVYGNNSPSPKKEESK